MDITAAIQTVVQHATDLLGQLPQVFSGVFGIIYDGQAFTDFGMVLLGTAGFALAWAGIRLVLSYVGKLLNATRGGRK